MLQLFNAMKTKYSIKSLQQCKFILEIIFHLLNCSDQLFCAPVAGFVVIRGRRHTPLQRHGRLGPTRHQRRTGARTKVSR
jgi:hypothetical protein